MKEAKTMKKQYILLTLGVLVILLSGIASAGFFGWVTGDFWENLFGTSLTEPATQSAAVEDSEILSQSAASDTEIIEQAELTPYEGEYNRYPVEVGSYIEICGKLLSVRYIGESSGYSIVMVLIDGVSRTLAEGNTENVNGVIVTVESVNLEEGSAWLILSCAPESATPSTATGTPTADVETTLTTSATGTAEELPIWTPSLCKVFRIGRDELPSSGLRGQSYCEDVKSMQLCVAVEMRKVIRYFDSSYFEEYIDRLGEHDFLNDEDAQIFLSETSMGNCNTDLSISEDYGTNTNGREPMLGDYWTETVPFKVICCD